MAFSEVMAEGNILYSYLHTATRLDQFITSTFHDESDQEQNERGTNLAHVISLREDFMLFLGSLCVDQHIQHDTERVWIS